MGDLFFGEFDSDLLFLVPDQAACADRPVRLEEHVELIGNPITLATFRQAPDGDRLRTVQSITE